MVFCFPSANPTRFQPSLRSFRTEIDASGVDLGAVPLSVHAYVVRHRADLVAIDLSRVENGVSLWHKRPSFGLLGLDFDLVDDGFSTFGASRQSGDRSLLG